MYHKFVRTRNPDLLAKFKKYRNPLNKTLKVAKAEYHARMFQAIQNEPKKVWDAINRITNRKPVSHVPQAITVNDTILQVDDLANAINEHFIKEGIYPPETFLENSELVTVIEEVSESIFMHPTNDVEVGASISKLKNRTASGADGISARPVKHVSDLINDVVAYIINLSLTTDIFPNWRV